MLTFLNKIFKCEISSKRGPCFFSWIFMDLDVLPSQLQMGRNGINKAKLIWLPKSSGKFVIFCMNWQLFINACDWGGDLKISPLRLEWAMALEGFGVSMLKGPHFLKSECGCLNVMSYLLTWKDTWQSWGHVLSPFAAGRTAASVPATHVVFSLSEQA